jgi:hypothetical protein
MINISKVPTILRQFDSRVFVAKYHILELKQMAYVIGVRWQLDHLFHKESNM